MSKEVATTASAEALAQLQQEFPQDASYTRVMMPRLTYKSQDVMEGKGKSKKVVTEAGTFFTERETEELNPETGKKIWEKTELGSTVDVHIVFQRKQLRHYDEATEEYTNSPIFDTEEDIVPLFANKKEVAKGLPKDLKMLPQFTYEKDGKMRSSLEENRILYVLIDGEMHQLNLRGSSMYAFLDYTRKNQVNTLITTLDSEAKEKGSIEWNQMTFKPARVISADEATDAIEKTTELKQAIQDEKDFYAGQQLGDAAAVTVTDQAALAAGKDDEDF